MMLVAGSTGLVGGMIARRLLERGEEVRILVRAASDWGALVAAGAHPVIGDLKSPASLVDACRDADVVVTTASAGQRGGADNPMTVDLEGNRHLIDAARDAGVRQFIFVSALAATEDSPIPLPRAKALTESYLRSSGVPYTIVAANAIMDVMFPLIVGMPFAAGRPVTLVGSAARRHSWIAAQDVAAFAVAAVHHPQAINRRIEIGGPDAVTWRDVVAAYEAGFGRACVVRSVEPGTVLPDLPPVPGLPELVSGLMAMLETFDSPMAMDETARTFGVRLTSVDDYVATLRAHQPAAPTT
jgi:NADH dehydrogenase